LRVLLDECLPRKLKRELPGHEVFTVREIGWSGLRNGELLARAAAQFDVFLTVDANIPHQQNLAKAGLAVIVLSARSNSMRSLGPLMERVREAIPRLVKGQLLRVGS